MSDDLVTQIKERRLHHMYPHHLDELLDEAATAFSEARVVIERLRAERDEARGIVRDTHDDVLTGRPCDPDCYMPLPVPRPSPGATDE